MPKKRAGSESACPKYSRASKRPRAEIDPVARQNTCDSESTKVASISNAKKILDSYNASIQRDHNDIVKPALYAFLEFLPESGRHELITDINQTGGNEEPLYGVFDNLYTGLRSINHRPLTSPISKREQPEALSTSMHTPITRQEDF
ncbi:hypothetical protein N7541_006412 [Penicillium brevicompactum]|uniref:Uncharacterized protein n=1 Tax=Penicillium brevicompactum TaxID=5074 RepID=A0A9W9RAG3_PENBR|nr:hypothetical protein N7541_006412 [Penicillium brevicompactum]